MNDPEPHVAMRAWSSAWARSNRPALRGRLAAMAACAVALTLSGCAAYPSTPSNALVDDTGDIWNPFSREPGRWAFGPERQPDRQQGDILDTVITHGEHYVVIHAEFVELNRVDDYLGMAGSLRTDTGRVANYSLDASPRPFSNQWRGRSRFDWNVGRTAPGCRVTHRIDYTANVAVIRIGRSCLNDPRTVQASCAAETHDGWKVFDDDAGRRGPIVNAPRYTTPIRRAQTAHAWAP